MTELFEHQKTGIAFLKETKKAILADSMGLGKTRQAIVAAKETTGGAIVICPASLKINWQREINLIYPTDRVTIVQGSKEPKDKAVEWIVINYDILKKQPWLYEELHRLGTLVLDEAHYIKGQSMRAKATIDLAMIAKQVYCLTGTPVMNRPIELYNLLVAIGHHLGKVRSAFAKRYCGAFKRSFFHKGLKRMLYFTDESGATNLEELRKMIDPIFLRRKKEDVLDLPERLISIEEVKMSPEAKKEYKEAWNVYLEFLKEAALSEQQMDNILMARHLVEIQKLKQICSQAKAGDMARDIENAVDQEEKVIVFSQYTDTINLLAAEMMGKGISYETLTGQDDMNTRQAAIDKFQKDPETKVFIANIKAGGVGISLTAASIVMFADMDWSPEIHNQAIDRAHRIGQKKMVNAYFYVCPETIEDDIIQILNDKKGVLDKIVEGTDDSIKTRSTQAEFLKRMVQKSHDA